jgi:hypothetical protein
MSGKGNGVLGSLINGLGTNALAGNDPVKGLAINAALLAGSGGLSGLGSAAGNTAGNIAANTADDFAASLVSKNGIGGWTSDPLMGITKYGPGGMPLSSPVATSAISAANTTAAANMAPFAMKPAGTAALGGISPVTAAGPSTGMIPSSLYQPTFMERVTGGLDSLGQYTQQNPVLTQMAMQGAQSLLQQQQPQLQSPGLMRGSPIQAQAPQYQVGVPQISLI